MSRRRSSNQGQPEAKAAWIGCRSQHEKPISHRQRNSRPAVGDGEFNLLAYPCRRELHASLGLLRHGIERIAEQRGERRYQLAGIAPEMRVAGRDGKAKVRASQAD